MPSVLQADFINTVFDVAGTPMEVMPYNPLRRYLLIQNRTANRIFLSFGNTANSLDGIIIEGNWYYEPYITPLSSVNLYSPTLGQVIIIEGVPERK